jgi:hypothetical protein
MLLLLLLHTPYRQKCKCRYRHRYRARLCVGSLPAGLVSKTASIRMAKHLSMVPYSVVKLERPWYGQDRRMREGFASLSLG